MCLLKLANFEMIILQRSMKYVFNLFKVTMVVVAHTYKTLENIYNLPLAAYTYACYF